MIIKKYICSICGKEFNNEYSIIGSITHENYTSINNVKAKVHRLILDNNITNFIKEYDELSDIIKNEIINCMLITLKDIDLELYQTIKNYFYLSMEIKQDE